MGRGPPCPLRICSLLPRGSCAFACELCGRCTIARCCQLFCSDCRNRGTNVPAAAQLSNSRSRRKQSTSQAQQRQSTATPSPVSPHRHTHAKRGRSLEPWWRKGMVGFSQKTTEHNKHSVSLFTVAAGRFRRLIAPPTILVLRIPEARNRRGEPPRHHAASTNTCRQSSDPTPTEALDAEEPLFARAEQGDCLQRKSRRTRNGLRWCSSRVTPRWCPAVREVESVYFGNHAENMRERV